MISNEKNLFIYHNSPLTNLFTFHNSQFTYPDYETGLTYMLARYYSQGYGRFLSPDPGYDYDQLDPMSWNLYSYVRGNPITHLDPTGKWDEEKRNKMRKKLKELKTKDKHRYMLLMHTLKMAAKNINAGKVKNPTKVAKLFVAFLDQSGLVAAFEDKNGKVNLGSVSWSNKTYLGEATEQYLTAEAMGIHLEAMDQLSEICGKLSYLPVIGAPFGFFSGWFGINGTVNRNQEVYYDPNRAAKIGNHLFSMVSFFIDAPGERLIGPEIRGRKYFNAIDAAGFYFAKDTIDTATIVPIQIMIDEILKSN